MVSLNLVFFTTMALFNFYKDTLKVRYDKQKDLVETETKIQDTFRYLLDKNQHLTTDNEKLQLLNDRIFEIANVNNTTISIYDLKGNINNSSRNVKTNLDASVLEPLLKNKKRVIIESIDDKNNLSIYHVYHFLFSEKQPIAIINITF